MNKITITSVTKDSPGAGQVTIVGSYASFTPSLPSQTVTVENIPTNPNWSRAVRVTQEAITILRNGSTSIAIDVPTLCSILGVTMESSLTYAPYVTAQPADASCVHSSTSANFSVTINSEISGSTYQWQESTDGVSFSNLSNGGIYSNVTTATMTITPTATTQNGYYYRCVITNSIGSTNSSSAQLTVT